MEWTYGGTLLGSRSRFQSQQLFTNPQLAWNTSTAAGCNECLLNTNLSIIIIIACMNQLLVIKSPPPICPVSRSEGESRLDPLGHFCQCVGHLPCCAGGYCLHLCFISLLLSAPGSAQAPDHHTPVLLLLSAHLAHITPKTCGIKPAPPLPPGSFPLLFQDCSMHCSPLVYGAEAFSSWLMYCRPFLPVLLSFHKCPFSRCAENRPAVCGQ